ncbi:MAG: family 20 glycosylhydrolase [Bacteroidales bacterium]|nr:family 20 glycosylhydrolase [Bacteroidales bacterium]
MKCTFFSIFLLFSCLATALDLPKQFQLIPSPQKVEVRSLNGIKFNDITYISSENNDFPVLGDITDKLPRTKRSGKGVTLKIDKSVTPNYEEGYILDIQKSGVEIKANSNKGLFYGVQTLEQLLEDSRDFNKSIPLLHIEDFPSIDYRAVHFDTKHHLDKMDYYYRCIDKLAHYKINAVIWEIEDKLRYVRRPEVGAQNAMSIEEMQALSKYAIDRNVEISPLIQGLGHASFILKHHWEVRENPESDWEFCPSNPQTYEIQFDLYRDALEAMPYGRYLHVGGDEITQIGIDQRCTERGLSAFQLQMEWLSKVCDFAVKNGRTPIFWDDMPLKYAQVWDLIFADKTDEEINEVWNTEKLDKAIEMFPKDCIYMRWCYEDPERTAHKKILKWYHDKGLKVMAATSASAGDSPFMPRNNTRTPYIKAFSTLTANNHLEGILATAWDDGSPHWETVWRGFIGQGEFGWNPTKRSIDEFKKAHSQREFGLNYDDNYTQFIDSLEKSVFFFDGALVKSGRRNPAWGVNYFEIIDLPDINNKGKWNEKYIDRIEEAKAQKERFITISAEIEKAKSNALRNRYTLEIYQQLSNLFYFPAQIIIALNEYDLSKNENERREALEKIKTINDGFTDLRNEIENVYSKTRFLSNPSGYMLDMNHARHLASKTNNNDWMFLYEIPMNKAINDWILQQQK